MAEIQTTLFHFGRGLNCLLKMFYRPFWSFLIGWVPIKGGAIFLYIIVDSFLFLLLGGEYSISFLYILSH